MYPPSGSVVSRASRSAITAVHYRLPRMETTKFALGERARREELRDLYDRFAPQREDWQRRNRAYYRNIERLVRFTVPEGASVLEIGSGLGDLLAALEP